MANGLGRTASLTRIGLTLTPPPRRVRRFFAALALVAFAFAAGFGAHELVRAGSCGPPLGPVGSGCVCGCVSRAGARPLGTAGSLFKTPIFLLSCAASLSRRNMRAESAPTCSSVNGIAIGSAGAAPAAVAAAGRDRGASSASQ